MLNCLFAEFFSLDLFLSFKAQCFRQIEDDLYLAGCHVLHRDGAIIW